MNMHLNILWGIYTHDGFIGQLYILTYTCLLVNREKYIMNGSYGKCNIVSASFSEVSWDAESYGHKFSSLAFAIRKFPFLFTTVPFWHKSAAMWCVETMTQMHRNRFRSPAGQLKKKQKKTRYSIPFCWLFDRNSTYLESSSLGILWNSLWQNSSFCIYCSQRLQQKSSKPTRLFFADLGDLGRSLESEFFRQSLDKLLMDSIWAWNVWLFSFLFFNSSNNQNLKIVDFYQSQVKPFQRSSSNQFLEFLIGFWRLWIFETYKEPYMNITRLMTNIYPEKGPFQSGKQSSKHHFLQGELLLFCELVNMETVFCRNVRARYISVMIEAIMVKNCPNNYGEARNNISQMLHVGNIYLNLP